MIHGIRPTSVYADSAAARSTPARSPRIPAGVGGRAGDQPDQRGASPYSHVPWKTSETTRPAVW